MLLKGYMMTKQKYLNAFHLQSTFFTLCLFLLGLLITLMALLESVPSIRPFASWTLTRHSTRLRFSSASLMNRRFRTHLPPANGWLELFWYQSSETANFDIVLLFIDSKVRAFDEDG
jgi:hypothetical protein